MSITSVGVQLPPEMDGKILSLQGSSPIFTDTQRDESNKLIFVKRIPGIITALEFAKLALEYAVKGPIIDIKYRRHTGGDKTAFALIYFQEEEDGKGAIEGLNGRHLEFQGQHRVLSAERASRWTQQVSRTNLYVTNLPGHWTGDDLKSVFDKYGKVMQATVLPHPQIEEQNSGAGFVRFGTEEDAAQAMTATDGQPATPGSDKILEVKYAKANIHKSRRNDPLVNAALLKDFRKRKAEFLNPHASKRIRYTAPITYFATNPYLQTGMTRMPMMYIPTMGAPGLASTVPSLLGGLQTQLPQNGLLQSQIQQNQLLHQAMLQTPPSQYVHQNSITQQFLPQTQMTQPQNLQPYLQPNPAATLGFPQNPNQLFPQMHTIAPQQLSPNLVGVDPSASTVKEEPAIISGAPRINLNNLKAST